MKVHYAQTPPVGLVLFIEAKNGPYEDQGFGAVSDGVNWRYLPHTYCNENYHPNIRGYLADKELRWFTSKSERLLTETQQLFRWAYKKAKALSPECTETAQPLDVGITAALADLGLTMISYGYKGTVGRNQTRTEEDVLRLVSEAVHHCHSVWGWSPAPKLEVHYMPSGGAMGVAYAPGKGKDTGVRRLALHKALIRDYDDLSVRRVVLHELCHHYRDECHGRSLDDHDRLFADALRRVDPLIKEDAKFFILSENTLVPAAAAAAAKRKDKVVWTADAGMLMVKACADRTLSLNWVPRPELPKALRWKPVKVWSKEGLLPFARRFSANDRYRVLVDFDQGDRTERWVTGSLVRLVRSINQPLSMLYNAQGFLLIYCSMVAPQSQKATFDFLRDEGRQNETQAAQTTAP